MGIQTITAVAVLLCVVGSVIGQSDVNEPWADDSPLDLEIEEEMNMTSEEFNMTSEEFNMSSEEFNMTSEEFNMSSEEMNMTSAEMNMTAPGMNARNAAPNVNAEERRRDRVTARLERRRCMSGCKEQIALAGCNCRCGRRRCDEGEICARGRGGPQCVEDPLFEL